MTRGAGVKIEHYFQVNGIYSESYKHTSVNNVSKKNNNV